MMDSAEITSKLNYALAIALLIIFVLVVLRGIRR